MKENDKILKWFGIEYNKNYYEKDLKPEYHSLSKKYHPDKGGNTKDMQEINEAWGFIEKKFDNNGIFQLNNFINNNDIKKQSYYNNKNYTYNPLVKCKICNKENIYDVCVECIIEQNKKKKAQRIKRVRTFIFCLNCNESLYNRTFNTLYCNSKCNKNYNKYKKSKKYIKKEYDEDVLNEEDNRRISRIPIDLIITYEYKEKLLILTRLIGKHKSCIFIKNYKK